MIRDAFSQQRERQRYRETDRETERENQIIFCDSAIVFILYG